MHRLHSTDDRPGRRATGPGAYASVRCGYTRQRGGGRAHSAGATRYSEPVQAARRVFDRPGGQCYEEALELAFSKNCITLQISGPDVADLSFCDLPGMSFGFSASLRLSDAGYRIDRKC